MKKKIGIGVGSFLGVLIISAVVLLVLAMRPAMPSPPPLSSPLPSPQPGPSEKPGLSILEQVAAIQEKIRQTQQTGRPQEFELVITEGAANEEFSKGLASGAAAAEFTLQEVTTYLRQGYVQIVVLGQYRGTQLAPITIRATAAVKDGRPAVTVENIAVGGLPLPGTESLVNNLLSSQLNRPELNRPDLELTAIVLMDQHAVIKGITKKAS